MNYAIKANNLKARNKSVTSQGMILSAVDADGRLVLVQPRAKVADGATVG